MEKKPKVLSEQEELAVRGKILAGHATQKEILQLIYTFDSHISDYRGALEYLASCMPEEIYIYEAGDKTWWSSEEPDNQDLYVKLNFRELLDGE
jgi:hypothetical protein